MVVLLSVSNVSGNVKLVQLLPVIVQYVILRLLQELVLLTVIVRQDILTMGLPNVLNVLLVVPHVQTIRIVELVLHLTR